MDGTEVTVNGRAIRPPYQFVKVLPGRHVVVAKNERLGRTKEMQINIEPDARVSRSMDLNR